MTVDDGALKFRAQSQSYGTVKRTNFSPSTWTLPQKVYFSTPLPVLAASKRKITFTN